MTVPASILVSSALSVGVSACVSPGLAFDVTFAVSLVFLARALFPDLVDGAFAHVDDCVQRRARLARVAIGKRAARILRDVARRHPVVAPIYALAEERARRASAIVADGVGWMKTTAMDKWGGFKDAAVAAFFWLRLIVGVINLAATVLINIAFEEAKSRAPSVLGWRGVSWIRSPPNEEEAARRGSRPDTTWLLVWISAIVMYCTQVFVLESLCSGTTTFASFFACFAALCGFALMEAERVYHWDSNHIATTDSSTANQGRPVGNAAGGTAGFSLRVAWESLWFLIILTYFGDACFLYIVLGKRPLALASLAIFKLTALTLARQVYLTPDEGEEATSSGDGAQGNLNKWHRAAMVVLAIESAKVFVTYLFIDFFLGALCFASLCATAAFLFDEAICLPDVHAPGNDENQDGAGLAMDLGGDAEDFDDVHNRESAGLARDLAGDAEGSDDVHNRGCAALARDIPRDDKGSGDVHAEDPSAAAACDHEKEGSTTDEQSSDVSDSEGKVKEQHHEEPGYSSSSSMDDWSHVGVDPTMPTDVNGGAGRKFSFLSMRVRG